MCPSTKEARALNITYLPLEDLCDLISASERLARDEGEGGFAVALLLAHPTLGEISVVQTGDGGFVTWQGDPDVYAEALTWAHRFQPEPTNPA